MGTDEEGAEPENSGRVLGFVAACAFFVGCLLGSWIIWKHGGGR